MSEEEKSLTSEEELLNEADLQDLSLPFEFTTVGEVLQGVFLGVVGEFRGMDGKLVPRFALYSEERGIVGFNGGVTLQSLRFVPEGTLIRLTYTELKKLPVGQIKLIRIQCPKGFIRSVAENIVKSGGYKAITAGTDSQDFDPFADEVPPVPTHS